MAQAQAADFGPEDRYQHGCVVAEGRDGKALDPAGDRVIRARETHECLLDRLREKGRLGQGDDAERRYSAGLWLRQCYTRAGIHPRTTSAFEQTSLGKKELTDAQAWNQKAYREAMREMGFNAGTVERISVHDDPRGKILALHQGLDALAKHRGID